MNQERLLTRQSTTQFYVSLLRDSVQGVCLDQVSTASVMDNAFPSVEVELMDSRIRSGSGLSGPDFNKSPIVLA